LIDWCLRHTGALACYRALVYARVRACAGATEYLHTYIHTDYRAIAHGERDAVWIWWSVWRACSHSQKQRNTALTLAHAQTIHYTSN